MDTGDLTIQLQAALVAEFKSILGSTDEAQLQKACLAIAKAVAQVIAPRIP